MATLSLDESQDWGPKPDVISENGHAVLHDPDDVDGESAAMIDSFQTHAVTARVFQEMGNIQAMMASLQGPDARRE